MTTVDDLWFLASEASQQAEQLAHRLRERHDEFLTYETTRHVSRSRFRTVSERIERRGLPFGAHTVAYRPGGQILLVEQPGLDAWVLPGGEVDPGESLREGARRELHEESGIEVEYDGLGILGEVTFRSDGHETWGVLPVFEGRATTTDTAVSDPDGEIADADWFETLPGNTRDREILRAWRERRLGE